MRLSVRVQGRRELCFAPLLSVVTEFRDRAKERNDMWRLITDFRDTVESKRGQDVMETLKWQFQAGFKPRLLQLNQTPAEVNMAKGIKEMCRMLSSFVGSGSSLWYVFSV